MNALFIFALSGFVAKMMAFFKVGPQAVSQKAWLYAALQALPLQPVQASLLWALLFSGAMYLVAWVLWKKRWFIKA
jgi:predicted acyltransferase